MAMRFLMAFELWASNCLEETEALNAQGRYRYTIHVWFDEFTSLHQSVILST